MTDPQELDGSDGHGDGGGHFDVDLEVDPELDGRATDPLELDDRLAVAVGHCVHCAAELPQGARMCEHCGRAVVGLEASLSRHAQDDEADATNKPTVRCIMCGVQALPPRCPACGARVSDPDE